jgi:hypothetical protein
VSLVTGVTGDVARCVILRSGDGGRTWSAPIPLPDLAGNPGGRCFSNDVAYAPDGKRVYAAYTDGPIGSSVLVSSSTDDGATWQKPAVAIEDPYGDRSFFSPSIATPLRESDAKRVYLTVQSSFGNPGRNISFSRSDDRGLTWGSARGIAGGNSENRVGGGQVAGGIGGEVLISWFEDERAPDLIPGFWIIRSPDHGTNFDPPVRVATDYAGFASDVKIGRAGVAHLVYERRSRRPLKDFGDIGYTWSPPPYTTWAAPVTISDAARPREQVEPSLVVEPCGSGSLLHVIWWDNRLSPSSDPDRLSDIYYTRKLARTGAAWSPNLRISNRSSLTDFRSREAPEIAAGAGRLFATWTDRRDKTDPNDHETDVYGSGILSGVSCR